MDKQHWLLITLLLAALNSAAQMNNPIFTGGPADGWGSNNYQQPENNIFTGGPGDGWASNNYQQPENNIFFGGGGDGWANDTTSFTLDFGDAINESTFGSALHAYPNPTNGLLNIDITGNWGPVLIEISSASGQLVTTQRHINTGTIVIDVTGGSGVYFVKLTSSTGDHTSFRVIKH